MRYKIKKRPSGSYTIVSKNHWWEKWELCSINIVEWPDDMDHVFEIQSVFPKFVPINARPIFVTKNSREILYNILDSLRDTADLDGITTVYYKGHCVHGDENVSEYKVAGTPYRLMYIWDTK